MATLGAGTSQIGATTLLTRPAAMSAAASIGALPTTTFYQPELDTLRFVAFLGVFSYHCIPSTPALYKGWPHPAVSLIGAILTSGAFCVALFFTLSAYLITNLLLREREERGFVDMRRFYIRRILRIWPLYCAFLVGATFLSFTASTQHLSLRYVAAYALLAANWMCAVAGYPSSVAGPLWSVSVVAQFYLVWPLVIRKASRATIIKIAVALIIAANASRVLLAVAGAPSTFVVFNTISCLDPLAIGILLAVFLRKPPVLSSAKRAALFLVCSTVLATILGLLNIGNAWMRALGGPFVVFACGGIFVSFLGSTSDWIRNPALVYLGKISYGLFVIHLFGWFCAVHLLKGSVAENGPLADRLELAILALVITIATAALSYRWLETPFLRLKQRFTYIPSRPI